MGASMTQRSFADFSVGDVASLVRVISAEDVARFVDLTGDDNPVHVDDAYAASLGTGSRVVHGMLTSGYVSTVIGTMLPGPGALWLSQRFNFRAPVFINDEIRVEAAIRHISPATRVLVLDIKVQNQNGKVVLDGEAQVQFLERVSEMEDDRRGAQTVVVTGSGRGIGAAIAKRLAADGMSVVVNYRSDAARAKDTLRAIEAEGGRASLFQADVADPDQAIALINHAADAFGAVDALINNAGGATNPKALKELTWSDMEGHLATHLRGSFNCVAAALPGMLERGFGRVVNVTSQAAYGPPPAKMTGYVVAKAALAAFTKCVALEAGPHGVTANAIAPGMTDTDMVSDIPQRTKMTLAAQTPLRRLSSVDDIAEAVAFLVGPGGAFVTGQTIHLSGGQTMP
jgi:3-oxoacyl-[acyl-carrier protein] reductase